MTRREAICIVVALLPAWVLAAWVLSGLRLGAWQDLAWVATFVPLHVICAGALMGVTRQARP